MNRQQRRRIRKLTNKEIKEIEYKGIERGINYTLKLVYEVMNEEFGFGDKRLDRLEKGILKKLKEER